MVWPMVTEAWWATRTAALSPPDAEPDLVQRLNDNHVWEHGSVFCYPDEYTVVSRCNDWSDCYEIAELSFSH